MLQTDGRIIEEDKTLMLPKKYFFFTEKPDNWDKFIEDLDSNNSSLHPSFKLPDDNKSKLIQSCKNDGLNCFILFTLARF
jgi:hypothetical protein